MTSGIQADPTSLPIASSKLSTELIKALQIRRESRIFGQWSYPTVKKGDVLPHTNSFQLALMSES